MTPVRLTPAALRSQVPLVKTALLHINLINIVCVTACQRRWWSWIDTKIDNYFIIPSLKIESTCKLINRIQVCVFWFQVYQAQLWECTLNHSANLGMSKSVLKPLLGKLDTYVFSFYMYIIKLVGKNGISTTCMTVRRLQISWMLIVALNLSDLMWVQTVLKDATHIYCLYTSRKDSCYLSLTISHIPL